jgi:hypothetical protein
MDILGTADIFVIYCWRLSIKWVKMRPCFRFSVPNNNMGACHGQ